MTDSFPEIIPFRKTPPPLVDNQLHLMVASLDSLAGQRERANAVLDATEQARAARFLNPAHGDNFRLVRGTLRLCLQEYLQLPAAEIRFVFNAYGKPEIETAQNRRQLHFNVSHSQRMTAFVFALGKSVGVDIEGLKPLKNLEGLARHVCCPQELQEFLALEEHCKQDAFFRLWTRKEAFIKAQGQGLSLGLRSIYIGFDTSRLTLPVRYRDNWLDRWLIKDCRCESDYKLAVAVGGPA